jgi:vacuolar-type H+-ATPase subunit I/STV1
MKLLAKTVFGACIILSGSLSANAAVKCAVEKTKFQTSQAKLTAQERKIENFERQQQNIIDRGSERTANLQTRVDDAKGQLNAAHINLGGDAIACWLDSRKCASATVRNASRRYGIAVRNLQRSEGALTAWQTSQTRRLDSVLKKIEKENKALEVRKQEAAAAEAAYKKCIG